jgi:hypothetical protein
MVANLSESANDDGQVSAIGGWVSASRTSNADLSPGVFRRVGRGDSEGGGCGGEVRIGEVMKSGVRVGVECPSVT